jgi:hypothetical protein
MQLGEGPGLDRQIDLEIRTRVDAIVRCNKEGMERSQEGSSAHTSSASVARKRANGVSS